jgi:TPR repeat protein
MPSLQHRSTASHRHHRWARATSLLAGLCLLVACNYQSGELALERGDTQRAVEIWRPLAERGDMRAALALGRLDTGPDATRAELDEAERAFVRVIRFGEEWQQAWAHYELAQLALRRDQPAVAVGHFEEALRLGVPWAAYGLGQLLAEGRGIRQDHERALRLTERAVDAGVPSAMTVLGDFHSQGIGVAADRTAARDWYERGAAAGDPWGHYALARMALGVPLEATGTARPTGEGRPAAPEPAATPLAPSGLAADLQAADLQAAAVSLEAAVAGGVAPAKRALADLLLPLDAATAAAVTPDPGRALELYQSAAAAGDAWAVFRLASLHDRSGSRRRALCRGAQRRRRPGRNGARQAARDGHRGRRGSGQGRRLLHRGGRRG